MNAILHKTLISRAICALLLALSAIWSGPAASTAWAQDDPFFFGGNYTGIAPRGSGTVTFTFSIDDEGTAAGTFPAPNGAPVSLLGFLSPDGIVSLAGMQEGTNYLVGVTGAFTRNADGSVTGKGPFTDSLPNNGQVREWTARRTTVAAIRRSITGRVVNSQGVGIPGITIRRSGTISVRSTDASGRYTFDSLEPGVYTITPEFSGLTFAPASIRVTMGNADVTAPNITALFRITGRVSLPDRGGVPNVRVTRTGGASVLTNSNGEFSFVGVPSGSVTVTLARAGLTFAPAAVTARIAAANLVLRFSTSYSISGRVTNAANVGIGGVTVRHSGGGSTTTDASGAYTFRGLGTSSFIVTPSKPGLTFTPASQRAITMTGNALVPAFRAGFTVSGRVTRSSGAGLANVRITRSGSSTAVFTDASGAYTFSNVPSGSVTITPSLSGAAFTPGTRTVSVGTAPVAVAPFVAASGVF